MPGGCWICNPMCGRCKPPAYKSYVCEDCGIPTMFQKDDIIAGKALVCKKCGKDVSAEVRPKVVKCKSSGKLCAYPCGRSTSPDANPDTHKCEFNTPPSQEWLDAHPKATELANV